MAFERRFLEEIKNRVTVSSVVVRKVKLIRRGHEFIGLSPFKNERTPSFTVNDDKHFYHCFSTGKHGSVFDFVMETEGLSFTEAVEKLARQAGLNIPVDNPQSAIIEKKRLGLIEVNIAANQWFRTQLMGRQGEEARAYLKQRDVNTFLIEKFEIGYAHSKKPSLMNHLMNQGFSVQKIVEAGLVIQPDDGSMPYDRFRNRIIFPVCDIRGRIIAFGGRILPSDYQSGKVAKYINSPETPLFHKGHVLFNFDKARQSAYEHKNICVVEGYMDVIGLARGGIHHVVAPLGTAITGEQIKLLWRLASEPILCLDGDDAGMRAGYKVIDKALPLLKPGYSLRFVQLPLGKDPDDLVKSQGVGVFNTMIEQADSMIETLWRRELTVAPCDTPERFAALQKRLKEIVDHIKDANIKIFYHRAIRSNLWQLENETRQQYSQKKKKISSLEAQQSALAVGNHHFLPREVMIILEFINHVHLLENELEYFESIEFMSPDLSQLRDEIVDIIYHHTPLDCEILKIHLNNRGYSSIMVRLEGMDMGITLIDPQSGSEDIIAGWIDFVKVQHKFLLEKELQELEESLPTQESFERQVAIKNEIDSLC